MEEGTMRSIFLASVAAVAVGATLGVSILAAAETALPIGGGYTNAIPIPVEDPTTKAIAGALFKPTGAGPFPAVILIGGCNAVWPMGLAKGTIDRLLAKGVATLVVDAFTPRNEKDGVCATMANLNDNSDGQHKYVARGGADALAALNVLQAMPDIDKDHILFVGHSYGAIASLSATDKQNPANHAKVAGVVAYYPFCYENDEPSVPVLVLIGEKDDWTPAAKCQPFVGKTNFEVVAYPGAFHAFDIPFEKPVDMLGHHLAYDETAAKDAEKRADAFIDAHIK
jgi:dienelactone hydrolase